ncbi:MAG TPA: zinc-binding dehydrogenase [Armatimonadota bacterium]|nr:zinc-binding dehydrogenase [Armatimonadota bacterium]HOQ28271.1 zinc-binding dehydrogenase [Armatimonadota bacterium]HPT99461.1 zinc-binding dehydrogenase [Armatimonadota bacterium]
MKKAVIFGGQRAGVIEVPDPKPKEDWALVKVHVAPMCAEYKTFQSGRKADSLGHEAAGEVVAVAQPCKVAVGDRVVVMPLYSCGTCALCRGGDYIYCQNGIDPAAFTGSPEGAATMAQYVLKPSWLLPKIPEGISYEHASLACCGLGPTFGACDRMGVSAFDTVLITGMGPVGLGGIINARYRGARVIAVESHPWRAERARLLGAAAVVDPTRQDALREILDLTNGEGVDKAIDCSGNVAAHRLCIDATRRRGQVAFVGECMDETPVRVSPDLIRKGLTLHGVWHYNLSRLPALFQMIRRSPDALDLLISHRFPIDRVEEAWRLQATGECAKVLLKPWE